MFLGISDDGEIAGVDDSNRLRSQIQDVANGCDPRIDVHIVSRGNLSLWCCSKHRMREAMFAAHLPAPKFLPSANAFLVENFTSFEAAGVSSKGAKLCRWLISHGPVSMQDIMGVFDFSKTTAHRRITKLMADGWIEVRGSGRSTKYVLSTAGTYGWRSDELIEAIYR